MAAQKIKLDWKPSFGSKTKPASNGPIAAPAVLNNVVMPRLFIRLGTDSCTRAAIAGNKTPERNATGNISAHESSVISFHDYKKKFFSLSPNFGTGNKT